jgi:hypothetical protein
MFMHKEGALVHMWTADPSDGGVYVGSAPIGPGEKPDSDELLYRLGVRWTPFDYDFDVAAGALGTYLLSRKIPSGAKVIGGFYEVDTTATSSSDAGTLSLGINAAADLMAATAISTGTTWDAAGPVLLPLSTKDTVLLTADRQVTGVIGAEVWTAGKLHGALAWTFEYARAQSFTAA